MIFSPVATGLGDGLAAADEVELEPPHAQTSATPAMPDAMTFRSTKTDTEVGYAAATRA